MHRRSAVLSLAALAVSALAAVPAAATGGGTAGHVATPAGIGRFLPADSHQALPRRNATVSSLNWSGYAVAPGSGVTAVTSRFTVPKAGLVPPGFAATWAGVGGYSTKDLIQAGVAEQSTGIVGGSRYYAWYEILPAAETLISGCSGDSSCAVAPGHVVTVNIHETGTNTWSVSLTDAGHWSWQRSIHYVSTHSSAEWILEAPTVGVQTTIAPVGKAYFGPISTYTRGGVTRTIAQGQPVRINLGVDPVDEAKPSSLAANGQSFNACTYLAAYLNCPTPVAHRRR